MPSTLPAPMQQWLDYLHTAKRYSAHTLKAYARDLNHLLECRPGVALDALHEADIRHALTRLHAQGMQPRSLARTLAAWRGFYSWWGPRAGLQANPAAQVRAPRATKPLPAALSVEQAQALLDRPGLPAPDTPVQWRDQAMFETLYSSGLRLAELVSLDWRYTRDGNYESASWLQLEQSEAIVRGKGNKTRSVPLGSKAVSALHGWLAVRHRLMAENPSACASAALFLGTRGGRINPRVVQLQLDKLAAAAGLPVKVHPHSLRHSFASHLLQSSQDLRAVQELLGHANISTTQIYTRLDFQHLASVYDKTHPRANRKDSGTSD